MLACSFSSSGGAIAEPDVEFTVVAVDVGGGGGGGNGGGASVTDAVVAITVVVVATKVVFIAASTIADLLPVV